MPAPDRASAQPFSWVDVFSTPSPGSGNRLMVCMPAYALMEDVPRMAQLARETGFSETVFAVPQDSRSYRVRIFTPGGEIPYAGHPTLGAAVVWGMETAPMAQRLHVVQMSAGGAVEVTVEQGPQGLSARLRAPRPIFQPVEAPPDGGQAVCADAHGLRQLLWEVEPQRLAQMVPHEGLVAWARRAGGQLVYAYAYDAQEGRLLARGFAADLGVAEDPATGSAAGSLGWLLREAGRWRGNEAWTILQGREVGRPSEIWLNWDGQGVWVGGRVRPVARGDFLPAFWA